MHATKLIALATLFAATVACGGKKDQDKPAPTPGSGSAPGSATDPGSGSGPGSDSGSADPGSAAATPTPATEGDFITVYAEHKEKKPDDPVQVQFKKFAVTKASFDPKNLEGGTATIEIDLTSIETGAPKRDQHLATADYLNVEKFAKITIDVANVKKKEGNTYTADAKISAAGVDKTYPVTFEVIETKDDSVRIKGEHTFPRTDFNVGKDPSDKDEGVARDLTIKLQLTLKKT